MVMDRDQLAKPMTAHDWTLLGHEYIKNGQPTLPKRRWFLPVPPTLDGLHALAHRMAGCSEQLHVMAREGRTIGRQAYAIGQADRLLVQLGKEFDALRKEWERELLESTGEEKDTAESREQLRVVR